MKSVMVGGSSTTVNFPCLMVHKDYNLVVLFNSVKRGAVVYGDRHYLNGEESNDWTMDSFKIFDGKVILSNE